MCVCCLWLSCTDCCTPHYQHHKYVRSILRISCRCSYIMLFPSAVQQEITSPISQSGSITFSQCIMTSLPSAYQPITLRDSLPLRKRECINPPLFMYRFWCCGSDVPFVECLNLSSCMYQPPYFLSSLVPLSEINFSIVAECCVMVWDTSWFSPVRCFLFSF